MLPFIAFFALAASGNPASAQKVCTLANGEVCLPKSQTLFAGVNLQGWFVDDDTCFSRPSGKFCFTDPTSNEAKGYCSCTGSGDGPAITTTPSPCCTPGFEGMGADNTMCLYCDPNPAEACGKVYRAELTDNERQRIVDHHNLLRSRVATGSDTRGGQTSATNIMKIKYSKNLEVVAQRWANTCQSGHDVNRNTPGYASVGQNVAMMATTAGFQRAEVEQHINNWYNEIVDETSEEVDTFKSRNKAAGEKVVGHYTQVVWHDSTEVGCGFTWRDVEINGRIYQGQYLVCNYGPSGNYLGQPVYTKGPPGADCPNGSENGLCL